VKVRLIALDPTLQGRSIRRGGLIAMAQRGASISQLLSFSKHRSEAMLLKYLDYGAVLKHEAIQSANIVNNLIQDMDIGRF
jgi:hypothetical protein